MMMFRSLDLREKHKEVAAVYDQHGRAELKQETRVVFSVSSTRKCYQRYGNTLFLAKIS